MLDGFLPNADLAFGLLGTELWSGAGAALAAKAARRLGRRGLAQFSGELLTSCRDWLTDTFASDAVHGLLAPWVLHTGLGPDDAASGFMAQVIAVAVQEGGMPVPRGGGAKLVEALDRLIADHGGTSRTGSEVESILVEAGAAVGVRTTGGETFAATRAVIANVTPTQLYGRLLGDPPGRVAEAGRRFRYGRSLMQIHFALSEPARWSGDDRLGETAIVHLTPGLDGVSRAVGEAVRGLLPAEATIVCGQPLTIDPSRAPAGKGLLWIQLQELPWLVKGDAAGELDGRRRELDRVPARAVCRPDPAPARRAYPQPRVLDPRAHRPLAGRPRPRQPEPAPGRPLRRVARARPELPLAPLRRPPRAPDGDRASLADRGEHLAGPGARRRLGHARRRGALEAGTGERLRRRFRLAGT